ncbi:MAG TPA: hypothetical protein VIY73_25265 [Polyangiaceae bacterium]
MGVASTGEAPFHKGCGVCRRSYDARAWEGLPSVATLPPSDVQTHLTVPAGWTVVLRRCTCGAVLAARSG